MYYKTQEDSEKNLALTWCKTYYVSHTPMTAPRRTIVSFEPSGPVAAMLQNETRGKRRGTRTKLVERAIVELLRNKYPKLAERFDVLAEEAA